MHGMYACLSRKYLLWNGDKITKLFKNEKEKANFPRRKETKFRG
jgi:hypothetical protein